LWLTDYIIDYVIDDEGYITSMNVANTAAVEVSGGKNSIIVKGEYDSIKVYNLSGMLCNTTSNLVPGIYIVDVDNTMFKVKIY